MLAVSTMVNNHCQKQGCSSSAVDDIMQSLEGVISYRCSVNDGNIKTVSPLNLLLGRAGRRATVNFKKEKKKKLTAISTFSPIGSRSSNGMRVRACVCARACVCVWTE